MAKIHFHNGSFVLCIGVFVVTLFRILRALSSVGVFVETEDHVFGLTPLSQCLFSNALRPIARMFLSELLAAYPHVKGYVAELPGAVVSAEKTIAKANLSDRCKAISYDFHQDVPPACNAYFLVNVLHDWNDEICVRILKNITNAMNADTRLWVIEYIIEPGPGFSVAKLLDIEVLVMGSGCERSINEYKILVSATGLEVSRMVPMKSGPVMMECLMK